MKLSDIAAITGRVEDGAWVNTLPNLPGLALKVRGLNCSAADVLRSQLARALPDDARRNPSEADNERIATEVMAQVLLVGWNITDEADAPVPCTPDAVRAAVSDPKTRLLRGAVAYASQLVALIGTDGLESDAKN